MQPQTDKTQGHINKLAYTDINTHTMTYTQYMYALHTNIYIHTLNYTND